MPENLRLNAIFAETLGDEGSYLFNACNDLPFIEQCWE